MLAIEISRFGGPDVLVPVERPGPVPAAGEANVWPLLESGAVKPIIHTTFPLRAAADAHRLLESSQHIGKIVLVA